VDKPLISNFLLELFFPSFCINCRREGTLLCGDCRHVLEISGHHYCLCQKPFRLPPASARGTCQSCKGRGLAGLFFALPFGEKALTKHLIYKMKEKPYLKSLAPVFASLIAEHLLLTENNKESVWHNSLLIPIPLHRRRLKERGFNQAQEIAKELSTLINVPMASTALVKEKETLSQKKLSAAERQENVKDAFVIKNPDLISGKKIFLVDDVYTTGSTMEACAKVLKKAGAKQVWGIALAREV